jgi:hypothetical protein
MKDRRLVQVIDQDNEEVGLYSVPADMPDEKVDLRIRVAHANSDDEPTDEYLERMDIVRVFIDQTVQVTV